jgi:L-fuculose-phosphate aldolase
MTKIPNVRIENELRRLIVRACRALAQRELVAATDGNLSARLPLGNFLITPSGVSKAMIEESSLLICDRTGNRVRGDGFISSEIRLHLAAYRERPEIGAVIHAHPIVASAFTYAGMEKLLLGPILPEVVAQIGPIPTAPYATPGTQELAEKAAPLLREHDVVLLAQHGAVTLGPDPWSAYLRMEKLEQGAKIIKAAYELAGSAAGIRRLTPSQVKELVRHYGKNRADPDQRT